MKLSRSGSDIRLDVLPSAVGATDGASITIHFIGQYERFDYDRVPGIKFQNVSWSPDKVRAVVLESQETAGNDRVVGFGVADTFIGGSGDDTLVGNGGDDVFIWRRGDGNDYIDSFGDIRIEMDVASSQVAVQRVGDDVILSVAPLAPGGNDGGSVKFGASAFSWGSQTLKFTDGTWSLTDFLTNFGKPPGSDVINGTSGWNTLIGGSGDDTLIGGEGSDTYVWSNGDGYDVIDERYHYTRWWDTSNAYDTVDLRTIAESRVSFLYEGGDLTLVIAASGVGKTDGGSIKILGFGSADVDRQTIESFRIGTSTWSEAIIRSNVIAAASTSGNDTIYGFFGAADSIRGGAGDDTIIGGYSDAPGGGQVYAPKSGNDGGSVTLKGNLTSSGGDGTTGLGFVQFRDALWTSGDLLKRVLLSQATTGDDTITGFGGGDYIIGKDGNDLLSGGRWGDDTLVGGRGDDTLYGGAGANTYVWNPGDGNDVILPESTYYSNDVLLINGVKSPGVSLQRFGQDINVVIDPGTGIAGDRGSVKLMDGFRGNVRMDGTTWTLDVDLH